MNVLIRREEAMPRLFKLGLSAALLQAMFLSMARKGKGSRAIVKSDRTQ